VTYVDQIQQAAQAKPQLSQEEVYTHLHQWQTRCDEVEGTRQERIDQTPLRPTERQALLQLYAEHIKLIKQRLVDTPVSESWGIYQLTMLGYDTEQSLLTTYLYSAIRREDLPDRRRRKPATVEYDEQVHSQTQNKTQPPAPAETTTTGQPTDLIEQAVETVLGHAARPLQATRLKQRLESALL